jgi:hypothetical protein
MLIAAIRPAQRKTAQIQKLRRISMNMIHRFFQIRALLMAALVMTSFPCMAQSYGSGKAGTIVLPTETHWGRAVLPAGEYTFKIDTSSMFSTVIVQSVSGTSAAIIVPESQSLPDHSAKLGLVLEKRDGEMYVKTLYVAEVGLVFNYGMHKKKPVMMAKMAAPPPAYSTPAK